MRNALFVFLLTIPTAAWSQQPITSNFGQSQAFATRAVTGKPYSGEETSQLVQTLADGTQVSQTLMTRKIYRDSQGRTRTERPMIVQPTAGQSSEIPTIVEINDPVANVRYTLDSVNKVAHRQELVARNRPSATPATQKQTDSIRARSSEKLDPQTIEGITAEGSRSVTTYPVGSVGNDHEFSSSNEAWVSPELHVILLSKTNDPRRGEYTQKLTNVSRDEPDPGLFQLPVGYSVTDEKGEFTIQWTSTR